MKRYKIWIEGILGHEEQLRSYPTLEEAREQYGLMIGGAAAIALIEEDCKDGSTNLWVLDSYGFVRDHTGRITTMDQGKEQ